MQPQSAHPHNDILTHTQVHVYNLDLEPDLQKNRKEGWEIGWGGRVSSGMYTIYRNVTVFVYTLFLRTL